MVDNVTLKFSIIDEWHSNGEVPVLIDIAELSLRHVDILYELITMTATRQVALLVHAETTDTDTVVSVTWRQLKQSMIVETSETSSASSALLLSSVQSNVDADSFQL